MTDDTKQWKNLFARWPDSIPKRGMVVNNLNEQMPFKGYMIAGEMILLERTNPDPAGSRFLFVPFSTISLVKILDVVKAEAFNELGFEGKLSGK